MSTVHRFKVGDRLEESFECGGGGPIDSKIIYWTGVVTSLEASPNTGALFYKVEVDRSNEPAFPKEMLVADVEDFHAGNGIPLRVVEGRG